MRRQHHFWPSERGLQAWDVDRLIGHPRLIDECDLAYSIILSSSGRVMDGMHRIARALKPGHDEIEASPLRSPSTTPGR